MIKEAKPDETNDAISTDVRSDDVKLDNVSSIKMNLYDVKSPNTLNTPTPPTTSESTLYKPPTPDNFTNSIKEGISQDPVAIKLPQPVDEINKKIKDLEHELTSMVRPYKDKLAERNRMKKEIADLIYKRDNMTIKAEVELLDLPVEVEKYQNLVHNIGYQKKVDLKNLTKQEFIIEKFEIVKAASRFYENLAKELTEYSIMLTHATDNSPSLKGYSTQIERRREVIQMHWKKILIEDGMKGANISSYLNNPYIGLALAFGMPMGMTLLANKGVISPPTITNSPNVPQSSEEKKLPATVPKI